MLGDMPTDAEIVLRSYASTGAEITLHDMEGAEEVQEKYNCVSSDYQYTDNALETISPDSRIIVDSEGY